VPPRPGDIFFGQEEGKGAEKPCRFFLLYSIVRRSRQGKALLCPATAPGGHFFFGQEEGKGVLQRQKNIFQKTSKNLLTLAR